MSLPTRYYHGGIAGLSVGGKLVSSQPHVTDGCPICMARARGVAVSVGEYREWARRLGERGKAVLHALEGAADDAVIDPPTANERVYITMDKEYARFYAARSQGDLYEVKPIGVKEPSSEDHFPTYMVLAARVVKVLERHVVLSRRDRKALWRRWDKVDKAVERLRQGVLL